MTPVLGPDAFMLALKEKLSFPLLFWRGSPQRTVGMGNLQDQCAKSAGSLCGTWQDQLRCCPVQQECLSQEHLTAKLTGTNLLPLQCQLAQGRLALSLGPCPAYEHCDSPRPGLLGCLTLYCIIFLPRAVRVRPCLSQYTSTAKVDSAGVMPREKAVGWMERWQG